MLRKLNITEEQEDIQPKIERQAPKRKDLPKVINHYTSAENVKTGQVIKVGHYVWSMNSPRHNGVVVGFSSKRENPTYWVHVETKKHCYEKKAITKVRTVEDDK